MKEYTAKEIFDMMSSTNPFDIEHSLPILEIFDGASDEIKMEVLRLLSEAIDPSKPNIDVQDFLDSLFDDSDDKEK